MITCYARVHLTSRPGADCAWKLPLARSDGLLASFWNGLKPAGKDLHIGTSDGDDAAIPQRDERAFVRTIDFFT
jgi:selenide, water dikinase